MAETVFACLVETFLNQTALTRTIVQAATSMRFHKSQPYVQFFAKIIQVHCKAKSVYYTFLSLPSPRDDTYWVIGTGGRQLAWYTDPHVACHFVYCCCVQEGDMLHGRLCREHDGCVKETDLL